ncbi:uncharacterized protein [Antedon mediterranea]|uniref:uncharacterized protein isoform X4 n=1 Tax=Antedon mediterranea TaxID=105859 RepID=UPI003AF6C840
MKQTALLLAIAFACIAITYSSPSAKRAKLMAALENQVNLQEENAAAEGGDTAEVPAADNSTATNNGTAEVDGTAVEESAGDANQVNFQDDGTVVDAGDGAAGNGTVVANSAGNSTVVDGDPAAANAPAEEPAPAV